MWASSCGPARPRAIGCDGAGWLIVWQEYLHLAIDDHSRLAYSEILPDEKRRSCIRFLINTLRFFRAHGVKVQRVMTDNASASAPIDTPRRCGCSKSSICEHNRTPQ
jgi:hypothetical protein